jgi:flagellar basal-body rod modification protein FlgD
MKGDTIMETKITQGLSNIATSSTPATSTSTKIVGKDDFMKLLLAQMKNQNPLDPMDGANFSAQLAQFSSLEQLTNMNTELKTQSLNQMTLGYAQSANLIGKEVISNSGNSLTVEGPATNLNYNLSKEAQSVTINILDKNGKVVATIEKSEQKAGMNKVTWDSSGAEKGEYTFEVVAKDKSGNPVPVEMMITGIVTAVHFRENQILATVNGQEVPITSIVEVKQPENSTTT